MKLLRKHARWNVQTLTPKVYKYTGICILSWDVPTCSRFSEWPFLNCYLQDCKYTRSSWQKYFNHSWVYGNFKTFFITRARVDWKQATTYLMAQCMYYVFNKFQQIPEMAQLLKIEFFRHNMAIACSTTLMKFHFHETLYSAVVYHRQNIISKYLDIFSKLLAKRKITRCLMGHMAHLTIFGFLLFHFSEFRKGGVHS